MTDYISKTDLLLALGELPQEASKREVLEVVYDMPTVKQEPQKSVEWLYEPSIVKAWAYFGK